jgi:hypothetical protein
MDEEVEFLFRVGESTVNLTINNQYVNKWENGQMQSESRMYGDDGECISH